MPPAATTEPPAAPAVNEPATSGVKEEAAAAASPGLPLTNIDTTVEAKLKSALSSANSHLAESDGHSFSYWSSGKVLVALNSLGQPIRPIPDVIDETDEIWVAVIDFKDLMQGVSINVSGCNRPPIEARVYGVPAEGKPTNAAGSTRELGLPIIRDVGKCAGADNGGPTVTVKAGAQSNSIVIPVNPVYRFSVGVGLGADFTRTKTFGVATVPGSTIATITATDDRVGLAALLFVGWYPFGRDFRKTDWRYVLQRAELFVALDPQALQRSLIIGGGISLVTGMDLLVGWRALTKQTELQPGAGLSVGSPFDLPASSLPTTSVWATGGLFVGVGMTNALLAKLH